MKLSIFWVTGLVALLPAGMQAAEWTTGTFNTNNGWIRNDALAYEVAGEPETGQNYNAPLADQWYTDDPFNDGLSNGATSILKHFDGWTFGTAPEGHNSVLFGGYGLADGIVPGSATPSLYRSFSFAPSVSTFTFSVDFAIIASTPSFPNDDSFGFRLLNAAGDVSLADFVFDPAAATTAGYLGLNWIGDGTTNTLAEIQYGFLYRLTATLEDSSFDLSVAALATETNSFGIVTNYSAANVTQLVTDGAIANGLEAADFQTSSIDWMLVSGDPGDAGSNYILVNEVSVVPEPSTYALLVLAGVAGAALMARRRKP